MIRTALTAMVLSLMTGASAMAACGHDEARMTCAEGMVYDGETRSCVVVSG